MSAGRVLDLVAGRPRDQIIEHSRDVHGVLARQLFKFQLSNTSRLIKTQVSGSSENFDEYMVLKN